MEKSKYPLTNAKEKAKESKIKKFFSVDIGKDLNEKDPNKKEKNKKTFKRVELFSINRYILFLAIALLGILVNVLVGFNLNFLYLRQILGFLFLMFIPGLLIMLALKIRRIEFWHYLVYTIGLSLAFVIFAGLIVNWILPALNITDKPLSLYPILLCFDLLLIIFGIVAWRRNKDLKHHGTMLPLNILNNVFFIIPMFFPLLAILGAFIINNHGSSILTMITLVGIALYALLLVLLRKHLDENIFPFALWMIALALLFTFSMRSWFISGNDISIEYKVFKITEQNNFWDFFNYHDAYNSCLSIIFVPFIYKLILNIGDNFIFKVIFPIIFSTISLVLYLFIRKTFNNIFAFISVVFFMSWIWFVDPMLTLARQEIAFIFFGLMLLGIFSNNLRAGMKELFFVVFGSAMIVSHYSTSYIALALIMITYIFTLIYRLYENIKIKKGKLHPSGKSEFYIAGILILFLLLFAFLWYAKITTASNGLVDFAQHSTANINKIFTNELKIESLNKLVAFKNADLSSVNLTSLTANITDKYFDDYNVTGYDSRLPSNYTPSFNRHDFTHENKLFPFFSVFYKIIITFVEILFLLGIIVLLFIKKDKFVKEHIFLIYASIVFMALLVILPYVSLGYNFERLYLQVLIFICLIPILGCLAFFGIFFNKRETIYIIFLIISLVLLLFNYGVFWKISQTDTPSFILENSGINYDFLYTHSSEIYSGEWIANLNSINIQSDSSSSKRLNQYSNINNLSVGVLPASLDINSYVYMDYANVINNVLFVSYNGAPIRINYPLEFLQDNKNKIYNNGESIIFK